MAPRVQMVSPVQIVQVYMDTRTSICNRIETDSTSMGFSRAVYLNRAQSIGVRNEADQPYYYLHALFVRTPSDYWLELVAVWDTGHGWHAAADDYFSE